MATWLDIEQFKSDIARHKISDLQESDLRSIVKDIHVSGSLSPDSQVDAILYLARQLRTVDSKKADTLLKYSLEVQQEVLMKGYKLLSELNVSNAKRIIDDIWKK